MTKDKIIIAIYVDNKFGVLSRVTAMFTRRGFNIDSLTVGETESPEYSRITITLSAAKTDKDQVVSQLRKLYNVKKVVVLSGEDCIKRELLLIKVKNSEENRPVILETAGIFRAKIIDLGEEAISIDTGSSRCAVRASLPWTGAASTSGQITKTDQALLRASIRRALSASSLTAMRMYCLPLPALEDRSLMRISSLTRICAQRSRLVLPPVTSHMMKLA